MKILTLLTGAAALAATVLSLGSCSDDRTYAELLNDEKYAVNNFLADYCVENAIPADTVFKTVAEYGDDAPYYRLDEDGMLYMQVINAGTKGNRVADDEQIYFRYMRFPLALYSNGTLPSGEGNMITISPAWFRFNNFQLQTSYQWGQGVQMPLHYLPVDCEVNIVIKSQMGLSDETANVQPYLWHITYQRRE